jgi:hypothetical protein
MKKTSLMEISQGGEDLAENLEDERGRGILEMIVKRPAGKIFRHIEGALLWKEDSRLIEVDYSGMAQARSISKFIDESAVLIFADEILTEELDHAGARWIFAVGEVINFAERAPSQETPDVEAVLDDSAVQIYCGI